jgi:hypothetical protein
VSAGLAGATVASLATLVHVRCHATRGLFQLLQIFHLPGGRIARVASIVSALLALVFARLALASSQGLSSSFTALQSSLRGSHRGIHFSYLNITPLKLGLNRLNNYLLRNLVAHFFYMEENYFLFSFWYLLPVQTQIFFSEEIEIAHPRIRFYLITPAFHFQ